MKELKPLVILYIYRVACCIKVPIAADQSTGTSSEVVAAATTTSAASSVPAEEPSDNEQPSDNEMSSSGALPRNHEVLRLQELYLQTRGTREEAFKMHHGGIPQSKVISLPKFAGIWNRTQTFSVHYKKWLSLEVLVLSCRMSCALS